MIYKAFVTGGTSKYRNDRRAYSPSTDSLEDLLSSMETAKGTSGQKWFGPEAKTA